MYFHFSSLKGCQKSLILEGSGPELGLNLRNKWCPEFGFTQLLQPFLLPFWVSLHLDRLLFHAPLTFKPLLMLCSCMVIPSIPFPILSVQLTLQVCILWCSVLPLPCHANQRYSLPSLDFPNNCRLYEVQWRLDHRLLFFSWNVSIVQLTEQVT